jgi:hypothetical protein
VTRPERRGVLRGAVPAFAVLAWIACVDTSAPETAASISTLRLPSPSVVVGDVLRDSTGAPAPMSATVFSGTGVVLTDAPVTFVTLDSSVAIDGDGTVHGLRVDSVGARILASVEGLQTPAVRLFVTLKPEQVTGSSTSQMTFPAPAAQAPADSIVQSVPLTVTVKNGTRGVQGFVVRYELARSPAPADPQRPTTFIADDQGRSSDRDTTNLQGVASRKVSFLHRRANAALLGGTPDTIIVRAIVRYLGADVPGSPVLFNVPVRRQP